MPYGVTTIMVLVLVAAAATLLLVVARPSRAARLSLVVSVVVAVGLLSAFAPLSEDQSALSSRIGIFIALVILLSALTYILGVATRFLRLFRR